MKFLRSIFVLKFCLLLLVSCGGDDEGDSTTMTDDIAVGGDDVDTNAILAMERDEAVASITNNGDIKVWKITDAVLSNSTGTIDISTNFNVVDDEFLFSGTQSNGNLEWRPGNDIAVSGETSQETLLDYYRAPVNSSFSFNAESSTNLTGLDGSFIFEIINDNTITATLSFDETRSLDGETLTMTLEPKTAADYAFHPTDGLTFTPAFIYNSNNVACCAPGMIGSYSDNSFFIVNREPTDGVNAERVTKFDITTGESIETSFNQLDFVSKQLHIINNELIAIGGQFVNVYPLDLSSTPTSSSHGKSLTRFGMAVQENDAYLIGGDLNDDSNGDPVEANKVFRYNLLDGSLVEAATLPENRFGARGTIVNNKLYIFGGTTEFSADSERDTIYIIDLGTGAIQTSFMPRPVDYTFVSKFQNLIYIAGRIEVRDDAGNLTGRDHFLATYNTETGETLEITNNLQGDATDFETIHGMTVFNNRMYILYGDNLDDDDNTDTIIPNSILVADLD